MKNLDMWLLPMVIGGFFLVAGILVVVEKAMGRGIPNTCFMAHVDLTDLGGLHLEIERERERAAESRGDAPDREPKNEAESFERQS